ncbi:uncharacterized protein LOC6507920 isoform X2 [Drosophila ananassae]|uniref:uncharacterized protein LOC6507920 isoform X2 n=1 Tax=Drosophila ananassae TaxID=7217 RepID=UPI0013A5CA1B|nr:uncharacterized protein LOC6507920 isoform X2 [Drosophila ananassae]
METINFNDFTHIERYEIIKDFLVKMKKADFTKNAQKFFKYYLRKFYKVPESLVNDIVYCQRAMKSYLLMHQTIVSVFAQQADADPVIKNNYIKEIEDTLAELNAECQYLALSLQDDIDRFCLVFTEQNLRPNELIIKDIVSEAIVPLIVAPQLSIKPHSIANRLSEGQLLSKYFIVEGSNPVKDESPPMKLPKQPPSSDFATIGVKASRQNLQEALKRARSQSRQSEQGLCTHMEHTKMETSKVRPQKRKTKPTEKTK